MSLAVSSTTVNSSLLACVIYEAGELLLDLEFRNGAIYRYLDVPEVVHQALLAAESKGNYFNHQIRNCFHCHCIRRSR